MTLKNALFSQSLTVKNKLKFNCQKIFEIFNGQDKFENFLTYFFENKNNGLLDIAKV